MITVVLILPLTVLYAEPQVSQAQKDRLQVATSLPDYTFLAKCIGKDRGRCSNLWKSAYYLDFSVGPAIALLLWIELIIAAAVSKLIRI